MRSNRENGGPVELRRAQREVMMGNPASRAIREAVEATPLIDTHEHLVAESCQNAQPIDFFSSWLSHYASSDLVSAGMPPATLAELRDAARPLAERWAKFAPYWQHARTTGYGRALLIAARDLYGVDDVDDRTWQTLGERIAAANRPGWYYHVLRERAGIETAIVDDATGWPAPDPAAPDPGLFVHASRFDEFIMVSSQPSLRALEQATNRSIQRLDDLVEALAASFEQTIALRRSVAVKNGLAYVRPLVWENATRHAAALAFERAASRPADPPAPPYSAADPAWVEVKPLQDYLMHQTIRLAIDHGLPIQIHTGLQEGNGNILANSRPTNLNNLFLTYPEARFDLFHAGYPYGGEVAVLAKVFPNVYADLCWVHVISPTVGRRVLREWIETVPSNKILAFGGDYLFVEGAYAHSRLARAGVARVLDEAVEDGYLSRDEALGLVGKLLHDNAARLFRIGAR